jgi:hypothetical protein
MYQTEALYHAQIGWTLNLLDVVDEAADPVIAAVITDLIYERLAGDGGAEAAARMREAQAEHERLRQPAGFPPGVSSA